jgi:hypothetical protein
LLRVLEDSEESSVVGVKDVAAEKVQEPKETARQRKVRGRTNRQPSQDDTVDGMDTTEARVEARRDYKRETRQSRSTGQTELNEPEETKAEADPSKTRRRRWNCPAVSSVETSEPTTDPGTYSEPEEKPEEKAEAEQKPSEPTNEAKDGTEPAKES